MKAITVSTATRLSLLVCAVFVLALGPSELHSEVNADAKQSYLLKVSDTKAASELIEAVGGNVLDSLDALNYVGASLTAEQLDLVSRSAMVLRISQSEIQPSFDGEGGIAQLEAELGAETVASRAWGWKNKAFRRLR